MFTKLLIALRLKKPELKATTPVARSASWVPSRIPTMHRPHVHTTRRIESAPIPSNSMDESDTAFNFMSGISNHRERAGSHASEPYSSGGGGDFGGAGASGNWDAPIPAPSPSYEAPAPSPAYESSAPSPSYDSGSSYSSD